jgi:hypothetical protein
MRRMTPSKARRAATALLVFATLGGVWLAAAPFLLEYQTLGADWKQATEHQVATGGSVVLVLALVLLTMLSAWLRTLPSRRRSRR